ncbi:MAG: hypothetical protein NTY19_04490 [Planctomycetota bacterium]|nr:hypothetical protein [Planctomycetota bacterium]
MAGFLTTGLPVVVCGMPEAEHVLSVEHTERRFKQRLTLRCFTWRTPQGQREFCGMLKKLDETLPLAETSSLANADLAGRFYLASRGVPDYLMTLVRGAATEAVQRGNEQIEMEDLSRIFERCLAQQHMLAPRLVATCHSGAGLAKVHFGEGREETRACRRLGRLSKAG